MNYLTQLDNLQRVVDSAYALNWQKEMAMELLGARVRIRELEARIKKTERYGSAGRYGEDMGCPWCREEIGPSSSDTKHAENCEAFTPEGVVK